MSKNHSAAETQQRVFVSAVPAWLRKLEWGTAILLTAFLLYLHVSLWQHAGGLWRDEQNTVYISTLPTFSQLWAHLSFDSFPVFWFSVVRAWSAMGLNNDLSLRFLGLLVGAFLVGALWWGSRQFKQSVPLLSLALLAFNPVVFYWGDSLRAYGCGATMGILFIASLWRYICSPTRVNLLLTAAFALLAVQTLYYNAVLLLAVGLAGTAVAARHRHWKRAGVVLGIGGLAALSLLPYAATVRHYGESNKVQHLQSFDLELFFQRLTNALQTSGINDIHWLWVMLVILSVAIALSLLSSGEQSDAATARKDITLFFLVALVIGTIGYFLFLSWVKLPTNPWHYILFFTIVAVACDGILSAWIKSTASRIIRLLFVLTLIGFICPNLWTFSHLPQTNVDSIAVELKKQADPRDLVLVLPWYFNVSFRRYYPETAQVVTIPPLKDSRVHRYDLVARSLAEDPSSVIEPVLDQIREALKSGHRVWMVGAPIFDGVEQPIPPIPPAPELPSGWLDDPYYEYWAKRLGQYISRHAGSLEVVPIPPSIYLESPALLRSSGWRE